LTTGKYYFFDSSKSLLNIFPKPGMGGTRTQQKYGATQTVLLLSNCQKGLNAENICWNGITISTKKPVLVFWDKNTGKASV